MPHPFCHAPYSLSHDADSVGAMRIDRGPIRPDLHGDGPDGRSPALPGRRLRSDGVSRGQCTNPLCESGYPISPYKTVSNQFERSVYQFIQAKFIEWLEKPFEIRKFFLRLFCTKFFV